MALIPESHPIASVQVFPRPLMPFGLGAADCRSNLPLGQAMISRRRARNAASYCGFAVVVELVVVPPLDGLVSVFEWVSELPAPPWL
jgi:hypothetical protein